MRRLLPLVVTALVVLSGCGTERPAVVRDVDGPESAVSSTAPAPTSTPTPTTTSAATPAVAADDVLAGFPLDLGYAGTNGDDGSPVEVTTEPATRAFDECGQRAWDPAAGIDVLGVEFRGEAEWSRGRTLVLFPTERAAGDAVRAVQSAVDGCPHDHTTASGWTEHTGIDYQVGDQSYGWMDQFWSTEVDGFDTGLVVYHSVRVGRAVLLTYEYGEGNGSEQTRLSALGEATRADQPGADAMADLPAAPVPATALDPGGAGPLRLGMSLDQVREAVPDARVRVRPGACAEVSWTAPDGTRLTGAVAEDGGLAYLSTSDGRTVDGAGVGHDLVALRAVYPDLEHQDNGLWSSDQGDGTAYAFEIGAGTGTVDWVLVTGPDQHCAG